MQASGYHRVLGSYFVADETAPGANGTQVWVGPSTAMDAVAKRFPLPHGIKLSLSSSPDSSLVTAATDGLHGAFPHL
jgi:hypothetical protein